MRHPQEGLARFFQFESPSAVAPVERESDWESVVEEAYNAKLLPALSERTRLAGKLNLSTELKSLFDETERLNAERNRLFLDEAIHVACLLNGIGIQPVALKGLAYLLYAIFPNTGSRYLLDIDLLVAGDQLSAAVECLRRNGYSSDDSDVFVEFRHHAAGLRRPNRPNVELHHRVAIGVSDKILPAALILADAVPLAINGVNFLLPSPSHLVTHLILHSQISHPYHERIFPPIRALYDLCQLQRYFNGRINWLSVADAYRRNGEFSTLQLHLCYANDVLGFPQVLGEASPALGTLSPFGSLRWYRRILLNRFPLLRYFDPLYLVMAIFSRRARLLPQIVRNPGAWPRIVGRLLQFDFYRNLLGA